MGEATRQEKKELLRYEENRLKTFEYWPKIGQISPRELAKAGFYYWGKSDMVKCIFCEARIWKWEPGERAMVEHKKQNPECPFIQGRPVGNVPLQTPHAIPQPNQQQQQQQNGDEIDQLRDQLGCKVCWAEDACVVFSSCKHMVCCQSCSQKINKCPMCRVVIQDRWRVFTG